MVKSLFALAATAEAATLAVTWEDCGATHAKVTDLQPTSIATGGTTTLTGTGTTDEDVTSAQFTATVKALGVQVAKCSGDGTTDIVCKLPANAATITVKAVDYPLKAGPVNIPVDVQTSALIPASLAKVDVHIEATEQNGESVICLDVHTKKETSFEEIVERVNSGNHGWRAAVPSKFRNVEHVKEYLGAYTVRDPEFKAPPVLEEDADFVSEHIPDSFDSIDKWPACSVIAHVRDQAPCGSCWAFGSIGSFDARACIATGRDIMYSAEQTAFCSDAGDGCRGGNSAWDYYSRVGVVSGGDYFDIGKGNTCYPYSLKPCAHHVPASAKYEACPAEDPPDPICQEGTCSESGYGVSFEADRMFAASAFRVHGVNHIMHQLVTEGPMYLSFDVYADWPTYKAGIYRQTSVEYLAGHAVTLVGYGQSLGEDYWKIKNSWNEEWGMNGHFYMIRGVNNCNCEKGVSAGNFSVSTVV